MCTNQEIFPSGGDELYLKSCAILMRDHHKQLLGAFRRRLSPESDLFQQDILVKPFCLCVNPLRRASCPAPLVSRLLFTLVL